MNDHSITKDPSRVPLYRIQTGKNDVLVRFQASPNVHISQHVTCTNATGLQ